MHSQVDYYQEQERNICSAIRNTEDNLVHKYPILHRSYRNTICSTLMLGTMGIIYTCVKWYFSLLDTDNISWTSISIIVLSISLSISILHEIEHDIIHNLYFKHSPLIQNILFFIIWIAKFNVNPWWRRKIHLHHHNKSGTLAFSLAEVAKRARLHACTLTCTLTCTLARLLARLHGYKLARMHGYTGCGGRGR